MTAAVFIAIKKDPNRIPLPHIPHKTKSPTANKKSLTRNVSFKCKSVAYYLSAQLDITRIISAIHGETCFISNKISKKSVLF